MKYGQIRNSFSKSSEGQLQSQHVPIVQLEYSSRLWSCSGLFCHCHLKLCLPAKLQNLLAVANSSFSHPLILKCPVCYKAITHQLFDSLKVLAMLACSVNDMSAAIWASDVGHRPRVGQGRIVRVGRLGLGIILG